VIATKIDERRLRLSQLSRSRPALLNEEEVGKQSIESQNTKQETTDTQDEFIDDEEFDTPAFLRKKI